MGGTSAAFAFPGVIIHGFNKSLMAATKKTPVIWIQAQSCSGCSVSLLNTVSPDIPKLITEFISLNFHQTVCGGTGEALMNVLHQAVEKQRKDYVLVVEGSIPLNHSLYCTLGEKDGRPIGVADWIKQLGNNAVAVLAVGTCAAYGGIPAGNGNATGATGVTEFFKRERISKPIINISGCPPHPAWIVGIIVHLVLKGTVPELDSDGRPVRFYSETVHENCENLSMYRKGLFAKNWGDAGCLYNLGCLGMDTGCDIPKRKWLQGVNSCTGSGSGCIGCTERVFPDTGKRGIYKHLQGSLEDINKIEKPEIREAILNIRKNGGVING